jgi:hypothetical protein
VLLLPAKLRFLPSLPFSIQQFTCRRQTFQEAKLKLWNKNSNPPAAVRNRAQRAAGG